MDKNAACSTCVYSHIIDNGYKLECRQAPPHVVVMNKIPTTVWPAVLTNDWCGHWAFAADRARARG